ncbi:MAG: urease accessory protein UreD [Defluviicoccus sp.]|nr:MAG: urease accessory protein UreD [Defluviicoccus sp.]
MDLVFDVRAGRGTRLAHLYQKAPLRVLFPRGGEPGIATPVLITTSGGLVGGDELDVRIAAEPGAAVLATTQAAEKVYRSLGADCRIDVRLAAGVGAWLEWLPQETILFNGARLQRTTRLECAAGGRLLAGEILVFGRHAHGESLRHGSFRDAWEVWRGGRLVWADALAAAERDLERVLSSPVCLASAAAVATAVFLADDAAAALALVRELAQDMSSDLTGEGGAGDMAVAATCVAGVLVIRWLGRDARLLREAFGRFWAVFRCRIGGWTAAMPRLWSV